MARAGFWAIGGYRISFRKDGRWYADEEPIENVKIARLFSRHVQSDGADGWVIDLGVDRQAVEVEDTPLVITRVDGDPKQGFMLTANDDLQSELDPASLRVGNDGALRCVIDRSERGVMPARFLRTAHTELASHLEEHDDRIVLRCQDQSFDLGAATA